MKSLGETYYNYILCDFCCTSDINTVEHPEDGHRSDRNM
jgi:hypothetical protein